jgi:competence ComEA-like helix-hairpin-helix protein
MGALCCGKATHAARDVYVPPPCVLQSGLVDLNTAGPEALATLPGLSLQKARAVVYYRAAHGPFRKLWDLTAVKGLGEGIVRGLQGHVVPLVDTDPNARTLAAQLAASPVHAAVTGRTWGDVLVVASWNLQRLSLAKPDYALYVVASVASTADVLLLQEVVDPAAVGKLLALLPGWVAWVSPALGASGSPYTERYAVLCRSSRVAVAGTPMVLPVPGVTRPPMVATLDILGRPGAAVHVVNFHAVCGAGPGARRTECSALRAAMDGLAVELASGALLLAGDFNTSAGDPCWQGWQGWAPVLGPGTPTTVKNSPWDNMWVRRGHVVVAAGPWPYFRHGSWGPAATAMAAALAVSDHLPIVAAVRVPSGGAGGTLPRSVTNVVAGPGAQPCEAVAVRIGATWPVAAVHHPASTREASSRLLGLATV